jgi:hypothetical protein
MKADLLTRRMAIGGTALLLAGSAAAAKKSPKAMSAAVMIEQTYLKAEPGSRADLIRYIRANWFAMDQKAVEQGLFTGYYLFEATEESTDWDLVVMVGYPQAMGYADPATQDAFKKISAKHKEVLIGGKTLKQLGAVTKSERLKTVPS